MAGSPPTDSAVNTISTSPPGAMLKIAVGNER